MKIPRVLVVVVAVRPETEIEKVFEVGFVDEPYITEPLLDPISTLNIPLVVFGETVVVTFVTVKVPVLVLNVKASTEVALAPGPIVVFPGSVPSPIKTVGTIAAEGVKGDPVGTVPVE